MSLFSSFSSKPANSSAENLSNREREVLEGLATGKSYKMIAGDLGISQNTMPTLIRRLYGKLKVNSATEAVYKAYLGGE